MTELRLSFEGLISYVPKREPGDTKPPDEVVMVMPDLRTPEPFAVGSEKEPKDYKFTPPTHLPAVVVETRYLDRAGTTKDIALTYEKDGRRYAIFVFAKENVSFLAPGGGDLEFRRDPLTTSSAPPDEVDPALEYDLRWVTSFRSISDAYDGKLEEAEIFDGSRLLKHEVPDEASQLVGTVSISQGIFQSLGARRVRDLSGNSKVVRFRYSTVGSPKDKYLFEKAVARGTENVISTEQDFLDLEWRQADEKPRNLRIRALADAAYVPIRFVNLELEEILDLSTVTPAPGEWDVDPSVIYQYSAGFDQFKHLPLPVAEIPGLGRGNPSCDSMSFSSWKK